MAKRYVVSPVVNNPAPIGGKIAAVALVSETNSQSVIRTDQNGQLVYNFAFSIVGTGNIVGVSQVSNSFVLPDFALDARMDSMESGARADMVQSLEAFDLDGQGTHLDASHSDGDSYRQFIQAIGYQIEPSFNVNFFDATEP